MASEVEIQRIRKDPDQGRPLASRCLKERASGRLTDWEDDFLEGLSSRAWLHELSYRQGEILLQIRDDAMLLGEYKGQSVRYLIRTCKELICWFDNEDDQSWVTALSTGGRINLTKREAARLSDLLRCYRDMAWGIVKDVKCFRDQARCENQA